ncbi:MAG: hypothetical protein J6P30_06530 [Fibrobacter sp.]|nr:hypothetical protein [Fibrobacter sp.]
MKRFLLILAMLAGSAALYGCATVKVEVDDAREGYAIYCNGKKVCDDSRNCNVPVAGGDEMYFEAEKNGVVYGEAVIHRGDGGYSTQTILRKGTTEGATKVAVKALGTPMGIAAGALLPLEYITTTTEYFPTEVMIPVMPPENDGKQFPWDQPDPSK